MQRLITSNITPSNHPINGLPNELKIKYLQGIGEALSAIEPTSQMGYRAKFCYDSLCDLLLGEKLENSWRQSGHYKHIKAAQSLCRSGLRFFRMSACFWWDVYRIAYQTRLPISHDIYDNKLKKTTSLFTKKFRLAAKRHFLNGECATVFPAALTNQSQAEIVFHEKSAKRILIVGTMSAGKSTLVNALVGRKIARVKTTVCTTSISYIYNNPFIDTLLYSDGMSFINSSDKELSPENLPNKGLRFIGNLEREPLVIIDTPGVDYAYDESHRKITYDAIKHGDYDMLICVNNGPYVERDGENELINFVLKQKNKKIVFVFNQLDRFDPDDDSIEESLKQFKTLLSSRKCEATVVPFSGKAAYLLKKELDDDLSKFDTIELKRLKEKMSTLFYDLGMYGTGICSSEDDYFARSGLTNLETIIMTNG